MADQSVTQNAALIQDLTNAHVLLCAGGFDEHLPEGWQRHTVQILLETAVFGVAGGTDYAPETARHILALMQAGRYADLLAEALELMRV